MRLSPRRRHADPDPGVHVVVSVPRLLLNRVRRQRLTRRRAAGAVLEAAAAVYLVVAATAGSRWAAAVLAVLAVGYAVIGFRCLRSARRSAAVLRRARATRICSPVQIAAVTETTAADAVVRLTRFGTTVTLLDLDCRELVSRNDEELDSWSLRIPTASTAPFAAALERGESGTLELFQRFDGTGRTAVLDFPSVRVTADDSVDGMPS